MRAWILVALASSLWSCSDGRSAERAKPIDALAAEPAKPISEPPAPAAPSPAPKSAGSSDFKGYPKEGWTKVTLSDEAPICVFESYATRAQAEFQERVKTQKLKAGEAIVFGAFGPDCMSKACWDLPSLQCWTERAGDTLIVHSRFIAYNKDGSSCTDDCKPVTAGCKTPALEAGAYTVQYGEKTMKLRIPSVLKKPCRLE